MILAILSLDKCFIDYLDCWYLRLLLLQYMMNLVVLQVTKCLHIYFVMSYCNVMKIIYVIFNKNTNNVKIAKTIFIYRLLYIPGTWKLCLPIYPTKSSQCLWPCNSKKLRVQPFASGLIHVKVCVPAGRQHFSMYFPLFKYSRVVEQGPNVQVYPAWLDVKTMSMQTRPGSNGRNTINII